MAKKKLEQDITHTQNRQRYKQTLLLHELTEDINHGNMVQ